MKAKSHLSVLGVCAVLAVPSVAIAGGGQIWYQEMKQQANKSSGATAAAASNIIEAARKEGTFTTFLRALEAAGMTCNKNAIPFDPEKPMVTSGIRVGSPAATTRGFGPAEFRQVADMMVEVIDAYARSNGDNTATEDSVRKKVEELTARFPIYSA